MEAAQADGNMVISEAEPVQPQSESAGVQQGDGGYGSGYNSDDIGSDGGYGSGYNSDDTAGAQPKTIMANMIPVEKMKNGWNVMTTMFGKGIAFTKEKAVEAYNSETVQSMKERTSEAAVWTKEKTAEGYAYSKEKAAPVIAVTKEKAGEAWEVTRESLNAASQKARPMVARVKKGVGIFPIRPSKDENSSAENSEYEGLSPLSTSPTSTSPLSFSPPLSPKSSRAESPVNQNLPEPPQAPGVSSNKVAKALMPSPVSSEAGALVGIGVVGVGAGGGVDELKSLSLSEPRHAEASALGEPVSQTAQDTSSEAGAASPAVVDLLN